MLLKVFVEAGCRGCLRATEIAGEMARQFPLLEVVVIDIGEDPDEVPTTVFAVPTYILNGKVVSLGNPSVNELASAIETATP